jgi:hypothetical protein
MKRISDRMKDEWISVRILNSRKRRGSKAGALLERAFFVDTQVLCVVDRWRF